MSVATASALNCCYILIHCALTSWIVSKNKEPLRQFICRLTCMRARTHNYIITLRVSVCFVMPAFFERPIIFWHIFYWVFWLRDRARNEICVQKAACRAAPRAVYSCCAHLSISICFYFSNYNIFTHQWTPKKYKWQKSIWFNLKSLCANKFTLHNFI
jgi:hypothetical protein